MHLEPFELHRPVSVEEAVRLTGELGVQADLLAGGTDLLPNYKMHLNARPHLVALEDIPELAEHSLERIGAMARLSALESDDRFTSTYPGVADALREVATPLVRARATVGGNLLVETRCFFFNQSYFWRESLGFCLKASGDRCHVVPQKERCYATFSGDLAPALAVLGAEVEVAGPGGRRRLPLLELYDAGGDGIRRLAIAPGEIVVAVHLPENARGRRSSYQKLRVRPAFDFPELGLAASATLDGEVVESLRIAAGGLETYPRAFDDLTRALEGGRLTDERIRTLGESIAKAVRPVHNTFLPPDYRRRMTAVFVRRALDRLRRTSGAAG